MKIISLKWLLWTALFFHFQIMSAQQETENADGLKLSTLFVEGRVAAVGQWDDGSKDHDASGFKGQYLNLRIDGQITRSLTFSYRQRLNKDSDRTFWDATDWFHLDWCPSDKWQISAGKQVVAIGGFEYDRAPIDLYTCSEFWGNIPCYQLGVSVNYSLTECDGLLLQYCNSPFRTWAGNDSYAYNLLWVGKHSLWETLWSVNMMEWVPGHWINYVALGNNILLSPNLNLNLDLMNRVVKGHPVFGKDCSVMAELNWRPSSALRLYGKYTYDVNHTGQSGDWCVMDGTEIQSVSMGFESMPVVQHRDAVRLFCDLAYSWGTNGNGTPYLSDRQLQVMLGLKWKLNLINKK